MSNLIEYTNGSPASAADASEGSSAHECPDRSVYLRAAPLLLPSWLATLNAGAKACPSFGAGSHRVPSPAQFYQESAAMLAVGLYAELDPRRPDRGYLRSVVADAMLRWALSLRGDGRPLATVLAKSPLTAAAAYHLVLLLSEAGGYQHDLLLRELHGHLTWLSGRPPATPWIEAALIAALADAALLLRRNEHLSVARKRARELLARQNEEGWFPERGGPDIGRLSLTIDALVRCYRHNDWSELREPLRKAMSFLARFVHPDGTVGGCYSTLGTSFLSPFGPEWLSGESEEAAFLAAVARRPFVSAAHLALLARDGAAPCVLGAMALSSLVASPKVLAPPSRAAHERLGRIDFPNAGWTLIASPSYYAVLSERLGSVHVSWREGNAACADAGPVVYTRHRTLTADLRTVHGEWLDQNRYVCIGRLHRPHDPPPAEPRWQRLIRTFRQRLLRRRTVPSAGPGLALKGVPVEGFRRVVAFEPESVSVTDELHLALGCEAVLFSPEPLTRIEPFVGEAAGPVPAHAPFRVEGGRYLRVMRLYREGRIVDSRIERDRMPPSGRTLQ